MDQNSERESKPVSKEDQKVLKSEEQGQAAAVADKPKLINAVKLKVKKIKSNTLGKLGNVLKGGIKIPPPQVLEDAIPPEPVDAKTKDIPEDAKSKDPEIGPARHPYVIINKCKKVAGALKRCGGNIKRRKSKSTEVKGETKNAVQSGGTGGSSQLQTSPTLSSGKSLSSSREASPAIPKGILKVEQFSNEAKEAMRRWLIDLSQGGVFRLRKDFYTARSFVPPNTETKSCAANPKLCRYKDVVCYDSTRVVLTWPENNKNDFIHANWVKHKLLKNDFICTQAPKQETIYDFWRMIWQEKIKLIIMLCNIMEKQRIKCCQYWPERIGQTMHFDRLFLKTLNIDSTDSSITVTKIQVECGDEIRTVYHRHWGSWPDKSVPKTPLTPFRLLQCSRQQRTPVVVHCSAGVGRTGTLVLIEMILNCLKKGNTPDSKQYLKLIRAQRAQAVQTEDQYVYAHCAIVQMLCIKKVFTYSDIAGFCKDYFNYINLLHESGGKKILPLESTPQPVTDTAITCCEETPPVQKAETHQIHKTEIETRMDVPKRQKAGVPTEEKVDTQSEKTPEQKSPEMPQVEMDDTESTSDEQRENSTQEQEDETTDEDDDDGEDLIVKAVIRNDYEPDRPYPTNKDAVDDK